MPTERIETGEILKQRHAYYQVIGPIGVGKSTFVDAFTADTKSEKSPESHTIIDGLKEFYTLDPAHYSFWVQSQFLDVDTNKLQPIAAILENQSLAQDGGRYQDFVLATLQRKMGWMSAHEYDGMYIPKYRKPVILEPDAIIYFRASVEKCIQGILKRGRSEEIDFLKRHPEYFEAIPGAFDTWVGANKDKTTIITVDITDMDIAESGDDRTKAIREVKDKLAPIIGKLRGKVFFPEHLSKFPHLALELSSRVEFFRAPGNLLAWADEKYPSIAHELTPMEFSQRVINLIPQSNGDKGFIEKFNYYVGNKEKGMGIEIANNGAKPNECAVQYLTQFLSYRRSNQNG